jgi:predicted nucleotide-binding protein (sugar kinase/HSP70/actin superfamily)
LKSLGRDLKTGLKSLGLPAKAHEQALLQAAKAQASFEARLADLGTQALNNLEEKDEFGILLVGRSYSACAPEADKGIPDKFAARGVTVIPMDMLDGRPHAEDSTMYWATGRSILAAARLAAEHPRLHPVYVTNFSCGPDSFLIGYFREIMAGRPSLILEVDSHTAHAGIETRIEAFLDVIRHHRPRKRQTSASVPPRFQSPGLDHPQTRLLIPCLGEWSTPLAARAVRMQGLKASPLPPATADDLCLGRSHSTCKECLPLHLTLGSILNHIRSRPDNEHSVFVMADAEGPCRFGQYKVAISRALNRLQVERADLFTPNAVTGYRGLGEKTMLRVWAGIVIGDLFEQMRSLLLAAARDPNQAMETFSRMQEPVRKHMDRPRRELSGALRHAATILRAIPLKTPARNVPAILLAGEIYVRHDPISRQGLIERLAAKGLAVRTAPVSEWILYTDWLASKNIECRRGRRYHIRHWAKILVQASLQKIFASSGLVQSHAAEVDTTMQCARPYISPHLTGEAALTIGSILAEMGRPVCGAVSLGPFGCMPSRLAQAVLTPICTTSALHPDNPVRRALGPDHPLPFLALETDGHPFPQVVEARLEAFALQSLRIHAAVQGWI